jgi:two-component system catabolic regulation response regulator CreB/two-component system response regulator ChvI
LLVDDEQDITSILCSVLQESGFEVTSFEDPVMALKHFKPRYYDLVILDIKMPNMNGFELYRQIRRKDNRVKVCFLTAVSEFQEYEQYRKEAYPKLGERHFVAKPISNDVLIQKINEMLTNDNYHLRNT